MSKPPFKEYKSKHLTADFEFEILNLLSKNEFNRITELVALICNVPITMVSFINEKKQWVNFALGLELSDDARYFPFGHYIITDTAFFEVEDLTKDNRFKQNELVTGPTGVRFYAGLPLIDKQKHTLGTLSVLDTAPKRLTHEQKRALQLLALEIITLIADRRLKEDYKVLKQVLNESLITREKLSRDLNDRISHIRQQNETINDIQEYKFLADSIPQIVWTSNPDGSVDYYNRYWFDYTGISLEEFELKGWEPVLHPDDAEADLKAWNESLATGRSYERENRFRRFDGVYRWHLGRALALKNDDGEIVKWFGSCIDIDEYKRALNLESKISQFEDFNRIIAHNLRGPAHSIETILDMVKDSASDEECDSLLQMLKKSSGILNKTLNELMNVLEVRNNKDMAFDDCFFAEVIDAVDAMLKGQIASKKATITSGLQIPSMSFPKMYLESIFYNIISNSLKYSKPGVPPQIHITSAMVDGQVRLTFTDNGLGIDLKQHGGNIFKLNGVFHTGFDSKGVGLFMTKTQIETFGGKISVESEPNVGTKFTIVF